MIKVKSIFAGILSFSKRYIFHFIILIILFLMGAAIATQYSLIRSLESDLDNIPKIIEISELNIKDWVNKADTVLEKKIEDNSETINSRIDIVDSAIKPDQKRRMLIVKIRDAITNITKRTIGARDLNKIADATIDYSYEFNLTIPQVLAQIQVESNFDCKATSVVGAQGCMQIMPDTLKYIQSELPNAPSRLNTWNIYHNIRAGCFYVSEQIERFGNYDEALKAYNWGPHRLAKYNAGMIPEDKYPEETKEYVVKISKLIEEYKIYGLEGTNE